MRIPFRKLLFTVIGLLLLAVGSLSLLTVSEPGSRWLIRQALTLVPGELQIARIHGRLITGLTLETIHYRQDQTTLEAQRLEVRWQPADLLRGTLRIRRILINQLHYTAPASTADAAPVTLPEHLTLPLGVVLDNLQVNGLLIDNGGDATAIDSIDLSAKAGPLRGLIVQHLGVQLPGTQAQLSGKAALRQPYAFKATLHWQHRLPDGVSLAGGATLDGDLTQLRLDHTLTAPFPVTTRGTLQLDSDTPAFTLSGNWQNLQWPLSGSADYASAHGDYRLSGTLDAYQLELAGPLTGPDIPDAQVKARGHGNLQRIDIEQLALDTLSGTATASGNIAWAPDFTLGLNIQASHLDPGRRWPAWQGQIDLKTALEVDVDDAHTSVALRGIDLRGTLRERPVAARGTLTLRDGVFETPELVVNAGPNQARISGTLDAASGLNYRVDAPQLSALYPGLSGELHSEGSLRGPPDRLAGNLELKATGLGYAGNTAQTLQARAQIDPHRPQSSQIKLDAQGVRLGDTLIDTLNLLGNGDMASHRASLQLDSTQGNAQFKLQGSYREQAWQGRIDTATLALAPAEAGTWQLREPVALHIDTGAAAPFKACWTSEQREICLQGQWQDDSAQLRLAGHSDQGHALGDIGITGLQGNRPALTGELNLKIPDIRFLDPLLDNAQIAGGEVNARLTLAGFLDAPVVSGSATLDNGRLNVVDPGLEITAIRLQARGDGSRVTLQGAAHSGDGDVTLTGQIDLDPQQHWPFELQLQGQQFAVAHLPDMDITANPDLRLQGSTQQGSVTGSVIIPHARITLKELPPDVVRVSPDQVIVGPAAETGAARQTTFPVSVNVVVTLGDDVHFEGLGLSTDLGGTLNVRSLKNETLIGNGVLELRNGLYKGYGQKLTIERGRLLFAGPIDNPALDIRATRSVNDIVVGLEVYGNAKSPQTRLFSDPAMSDAEILSYLVTGKPLGASTTGNESQALAAAAASLGANSPVAHEISESLGIEFGVQSGSSDADTSLVVSKQLSSRLTVDYLYGMFNETATIQFIYKLTKHLSLSGQSGNVQAIDLRYSINRP